jgi:hypothetical protein
MQGEKMQREINVTRANIYKSVHMTGAVQKPPVAKLRHDCHMPIKAAANSTLVAPFHSRSCILLPLRPPFDADAVLYTRKDKAKQGKPEL